MAKILDFNAIETPVLPLIMRDEARTRIDVTTPPEKLISEMLGVAQGVEKIVENGDSQTYASMYDLAARLMSFNLQGIQVTAEELENKYGLGNLMSIVQFFNAYASFITEIVNSKN